MFMSGTIALMTLALPRMSWPWIWPRRELRIADDRAGVVFRGHHFDLHDRLEQHRAALLQAFAQRSARRDFERERR